MRSAVVIRKVCGNTRPYWRRSRSKGVAWQKFSWRTAASRRRFSIC